MKLIDFPAANAVWTRQRLSSLSVNVYLHSWTKAQIDLTLAYRLVLKLCSQAEKIECIGTTGLIKR